MKSHVESLALYRIENNVTATRKTGTVWYVAAPQRWSFRADTDREALLTGHAAGLAQLAGRRVRVRVTSRPYPVEQWARDFDAGTPNPLPGWSDHMLAEQGHLLGRVLSDKLVFYGVELPAKETGAALFRTARGRADLAQRQAELDATMALPGIDARPATPAEVEWLLRRSIALGLPPSWGNPWLPSPVWELADLPELGESVTWDIEPYGQTMRVSAVTDQSERIVRYVAILAVGRMGPMDIPGRLEPWMQRTDRLAFPVEWSGIIDVQANDRVMKDVQGAMAKIRSQVDHFEVEHNQTAPLQLQRQAVRALEVEDELTAGFDGLNTRTDAWFRLAVAGTTPDEALARARAVRDLYAPTVAIIPQTMGVYRMAREFIPGEPLATPVHRRRLPILTVAAGLPAASAVVGDQTGAYIGETCGTSARPVFWDTHTESRERSGLTLAAGGLGSGKSTLIGLVVYKSVLRRIPWVVLDPSGPLSRLAELPELAGYARHINLLNADPGTLNPYRVVAEPAPQHYPDEREFRRALAMAQAQRRTLVADVLAMLLPAQVDVLPQTRMCLLRAIRAADAGPNSSPRQVIRELRQLGGGLAEHGAIVADFIEEAAELPQAQLIFPAGDDAGSGIDVRQDVLTVLTLAGLTVPREGVDRRDLTLDELYSTPLIHLAAWLTQASIYDRPMDERKGVAFDELHVLTSLASGRALLNRTARDSRKWNLRAMYASQNIADMLTAGVSNFLDNVFVGRTEDPAAQVEALRALRIPEGVGYEQVLAGLSPHARGQGRTGSRQFIFSDGGGGVEKIRVDVSSVPALAAVLDTTADPSRVGVAA